VRANQAAAEADDDVADYGDSEFLGPDSARLAFWESASARYQANRMHCNRNPSACLNKQLGMARKAAGNVLFK
jgi:hypothetical protein